MAASTDIFQAFHKAMAQDFDLSSFVLASLLFTALIVSLVSAFENQNKTPGCSHKPTLGQIVVVSVFSTAILYRYQFISEILMSFSGGASIYRLDCLESNKGGKRPLGSTSEEFKNPCFFDKINKTINGTESTKTSSLSSMSTSIDYSICRISKNQSAVEPYISAARDCSRSQQNICTPTEPCTPCEISRFHEFHNSALGWSRCQTCALSNGYGECNFRNGIGPYCWKDASSRMIVPCKKCCTDQVPMFDNAGKCY